MLYFAIYCSSEGKIPHILAENSNFSDNGTPRKFSVNTSEMAIYFSNGEVPYWMIGVIKLSHHVRCFPNWQSLEHVTVVSLF